MQYMASAIANPGRMGDAGRVHLVPVEGALPMPPLSPASIGQLRPRTLASHDLTPKRRSWMQTGVHALCWGLQRLGVALAVLVFVPLFALVILVVALVVGQAVAEFGQ